MTGATARDASDVADVIVAAEAFVQSELANVDGSHDWWHIHRVRQTALSLAAEEGLRGASLRIVELAALLHDVRDWKYSGNLDEGANAVREWLEERQHPRDEVAAIVDIVGRVGFKDELRGGHELVDLSPEFKVVQDADRLDAIGAIGIARTFCYGGARGNPMHVPGVKSREKLTKEQYVAGTTGNEAPPHVDTTINHFHEKLLRLKGMMKSEAGKRRAETRHETMLRFLEHFHAEWNGNE